MSVMCLILFWWKSSVVLNTFVELQPKLHFSALVNFVIWFRRNPTNIGLCWARMTGHGSSSVILLSVRSMDDNEDRLAGSSKTGGSMTEMKFLFKLSVFSWRRLVNTPSCKTVITKYLITEPFRVSYVMFQELNSQNSKPRTRHAVSILSSWSRFSRRFRDTFETSPLGLVLQAI